MKTVLRLVYYIISSFSYPLLSAFVPMYRKTQFIQTLMSFALRLKSGKGAIYTITIHMKIKVPVPGFLFLARAKL